LKLGGEIWVEVFGDHVRIPTFFALERWWSVEKRVGIDGFEEVNDILRDEFFSFARRAYVFDGFVVGHWSF